MNLKGNQLDLIHHLAQFGTLDYCSCLQMLDDERKKASYLFRPLTKNKYINHKDGNVTILAKGRALFPDVKPLVSMGGGSKERINSISRTAMYLSQTGIAIVASPELSENWCFVPSTCWRKIRHGILSTVRFTGMLFFKTFRLAVYDIGNGKMDWQLRAERSLFYPHYHDQTHATGMLFICDEDKRVDIAKAVIRETMLYRKQLIEYEGYEMRTKPLKYVRLPIKIANYYECVYLTTPKRLDKHLDRIVTEEADIERIRGGRSECQDNKWGDFEVHPRRYFVNTTTDLLKYVYFFTKIKSGTPIKYSIIAPKEDFPIIKVYPKLLEQEGVQIHEYSSS
jgi:hypothetical protein